MESSRFSRKMSTKTTSTACFQRSPIEHSKSEIEKAIHHFEIAFGIASSFDWHTEKFWIHYNLAWLFYTEERFDDAQNHIECARSHTANSVLNLGHAMEVRAWIWFQQDRFEEARSEALRAVDVYEKLGAAKDIEDSRPLLQYIQEKLDIAVASGQSDFNCEPL